MNETDFNNEASSLEEGNRKQDPVQEAAPVSLWSIRGRDAPQLISLFASKSNVRPVLVVACDGLKRKKRSFVMKEECRNIRRTNR